MESQPPGAGRDEGASEALFALGQQLIPITEAAEALKATQIRAEALTKAAGFTLSRSEALDSALAAFRSVRFRFPEITSPSSRVISELQRSLVAVTAQNPGLTLDQLRASLPQLQVRWADFLQSWRGVQESLGASLTRMAAAIDWDAVVQSVINVRELEARRELLEAFGGSALLPAPSMPDDLIDQVLNGYRRGLSSSAISNIVSGRYARSGWSLVSLVGQSWHEVPYLGARAELLQQSQSAMKNRLYLLVAPALVPQIEGISADFLRSVTGSGRLSHRQLSSKLAGSLPASAAVQVGTAAVEGFLRFLDEELFAFVDFDRPGAGSRHLNRHVLLHGRDFRQATRMNGVRAFILLDVLGAVVREAEHQQRSNGPS